MRIKTAGSDARWVAGLVLVISLAATSTATLIARDSVEARAADRFARDVDLLETAIEARMRAYEQVLRGARGLFAASNDVTRVEWMRYVDTLDLEENYPGIQGVGFSLLITPEDLAAHIERVRAEGFPDYVVYPPGPRDVYTAIIYLEPFDVRNRRAFGFDMFQEPTRNAAMSGARDKGVADVSGKVRLVQENETDVQNGFLMYLPVYHEGLPTRTVEERRNALFGWVYSPFRASDLMKGIVGEESPQVTFEVFDGRNMSAGSVLYDADGVLHLERAAKPALSKEVFATIEGHDWTIYYESTPSFEADVASPLPYVVSAGGIAMSLLLFGITLSLARTRDRAQMIAEGMTRELRRSEAEKTRLAEDLARSNEDLQHFAYVASHDLQEPLRMVSSYVGLLAKRYRGKLGPDADEFIGYAEDGAKRMNQLILDLLEYARIETTGVDFMEVSAEESLAAAIEDVRASIEEQGGTVTSDVLPMVWADASQLGRVFRNLLTNAMKYRSAAPPRVHVSAKREGDMWVFCVEDNGIGIDPRYIPKLFVMFSRLHSRDDYPGSGIGLAICKRIIQRHGGDIWVESAEGEGARFFFTLPPAAPGGAPDG